MNKILKLLGFPEPITPEEVVKTLSPTIWRTRSYIKERIHDLRIQNNENDDYGLEGNGIGRIMNNTNIQIVNILNDLEINNVVQKIPINNILFKELIMSDDPILKSIYHEERTKKSREENDQIFAYKLIGKLPKKKKPPQKSNNFNLGH